MGAEKFEIIARRIIKDKTLASFQTWETLRRMEQDQLTSNRSHHTVITLLSAMLFAECYDPQLVLGGNKGEAR